MEMLVAVTGPWCGQDKDHKNIFLCELSWQWFPMTWYWAFQEPNSSVSPVLWVIQCPPSGSVCCCICWSLQIIFAVVFVDFVLLDLVTHFYLICLFLLFALGVVCHSRINTEPPAPGGQWTVFLPPECANICIRAGSEPRDVSSDTRRCSPGQGQGHRVWNQHMGPGASGLESLGSSCLVSVATGKRGLDFRVCSHRWDVLIWFRSCFFRKFCVWSDWHLRAAPSGRVTWIITPPLCPIQKQRLYSSLRCLVCLSKRNKPLLVQPSRQGAHEAVIF